MAVAAFWIALAAFLIAAGWGKTKAEQMRHETIRLLIEKGATLDHEQVRELLHPTPPPPSRRSSLLRSPMTPMRSERS